jgi:hypothetical protein
VEISDSDQLVFNVDVNVDTVSLLYLADLYQINHSILFLLYDRYGKDVFLFFYMFRKTKITIPPAQKLNKIFDFSRNFCKWLDSGECELPLELKPDANAIKKVSKFLTDQKKSFIIKVEETNGVLEIDDDRS